MPLDIKWQYNLPEEPMRSRCEEAVCDAAMNYLSGFPADVIFVEATVRGADHEKNTVAVNYKTAPQQRSGSHIPAELYLEGRRSKYALNKVVWYPERRDPTPAEPEKGNEEMEG